MPGYEAIEPPTSWRAASASRRSASSSSTATRTRTARRRKRCEALADYRDYHIYPDPLQREARAPSRATSASRSSRSSSAPAATR